MSSRSLGVLFVLTVGVGASATAASGCSDDDAPASADAGNDVATPGANRPAPPETEASTPKSCREKCEEAHPAGLAKDEAINSCWETSCAGPCIEEQPGDGGTEDADAGPDGGSCASPVVTISSSCDECTTTFCCAAWDACFQDPECTALNACYQECVE